MSGSLGQLILFALWCLAMCATMLSLRQARLCRGYERRSFEALAILGGFALFIVAILFLGTFLVW